MVRVLSIAQGVFTVTVGFLPKAAFLTVMPSRLVDALTGFLVALGDGDVDADGEVESLGTAEGSDDDWPQADMVSNAAEHARASAVLERAEGTPRL